MHWKGYLNSSFFLSPHITSPVSLCECLLRSAMFFNPEAVKPISRPGPRPRRPHVTHKPDTHWKASSPATPREEHKLAGEGWLGRGKGSAAATAETRQIGPSGYGRGSQGADMAQRQSRGSRFDGGDEWAGGGGGGAVKRPETEGRPVGLWARGGGRRGSGPARRGSTF
uniref:Uncharacterized protein n=1 Tax=Aegilops tauschii subsp. strangulata TaxID=200361 RepID=A0A453LG56_AEGTS